MRLLALVGAAADSSALLAGLGSASGDDCDSLQCRWAAEWLDDSCRIAELRVGAHIGAVDRLHDSSLCDAAEERRRSCFLGLSRILVSSGGFYLLRKRQHSELQLARPLGGGLAVSPGR